MTFDIPSQDSLVFPGLFRHRQAWMWTRRKPWSAAWPKVAARPVAPCWWRRPPSCRTCTRPVNTIWPVSAWAWWTTQNSLTVRAFRWATSLWAWLPPACTPTVFPGAKGSGPERPQGGRRLSRRGRRQRRDVLLTPTTIYVEAVRSLLRDMNVKGMAHITGGGFYDNIPRVLPSRWKPGSISAVGSCRYRLPLAQERGRALLAGDPPDIQRGHRLCPDLARRAGRGSHQPHPGLQSAGLAHRRDRSARPGRRTGCGQFLEQVSFER